MKIESLDGVPNVCPFTSSRMIEKLNTEIVATQGIINLKWLKEKIGELV